MFEILLSSAQYVINAPYFYSSMGMTAMTSIFIGASLYNGDLKAVTKGILAIVSYAGLLLLTTIPRVLERLNNPDIVFSLERSSMAYSGSVTIVFLTIWYVLGMIIGVATVKKVRKNSSSRLSKMDKLR